MSEYFPDVAWRTVVRNVNVLAAPYYYEVTVSPVDPNEPGADPMVVAAGHWLIDNGGYPFEIDSVSGNVLTVYDVNEREEEGGGIGPRNNLEGYVYEPKNGAFLLTQAQMRFLDRSAMDIIQPIEKGVVWKYRGLNLVKDISLDNVTKQRLGRDFFMEDDGDGWQGGKSILMTLSPDGFTEYLNSITASGRLFGGVITSNGDGTVHVAAGGGIVKAEEGAIQSIPTAINEGQGSKMSYVQWDEVVSLALIDNAYNYIYYDKTTDSIVATTNFYSISFTEDFTIGRAYRYGTTVVARLCGTNAWNFNRRVQLFGEEYFDVVRARGMMIGETGVRNISVTEGILWAELVNRFPTDAFDSSGTDTFTYWYRTAIDTWTSVAAQSQIDNTQYNRTTDYTLQTLTNNRYGVHWVYMVHDSSVHVVYDTGNYRLAEAELASPPIVLPGLLTAYATIIGKIIVEKDDTVFTEVLSPFVDVFNPSLVTKHGDLSELEQDDHLQYALLDGRTGDILKIDELQEYTTGNGITLGNNVAINGTLDMLDNPVSNVNYIDFNLLYSDGVSEGRLQWNGDAGTLELGMPGGRVNLQVGQEGLKKVKNVSGSVISNGEAVYVVAGVGTSIHCEVDKADAGGYASSFVLGLATEDISSGGFGYVTFFGNVRGEAEQPIDTSSYDKGTSLWLSTTAGAWTDVPPAAPNMKVFIGVVTRGHATEGAVSVRPTLVPRLEGLSDVHGVPSSKNVPTWNDTNGRFEFGLIGLTDGVTGVLPVANGGTNISSYTVGDILYASGATTLSKLAKGGAYQRLRMNSGETAPEWEPTQTPLTLSLSSNSLQWKVTFGYNARVTLDADVTTFDLVDAVAGDSGVLTVIQDATGGRTMVLPSGHLAEGGSLTLSTAGGSKDVLGWYYDGTDYFWNIGKAFSTVT